MIQKFLILPLLLALTACGNNANQDNQASAQPQAAARTFLGKGETGYELWADGSCVIVKGATTADFQRLNTDLEGFKKSVKATTGKQCVLFE